MSAAFAHATDDAEPMVAAAAFVLSLRARGIADLRILRAMETVRREVFAPRRYADLARQDVALPLACGETMTAPSTVAMMVAALGVQPGHRVLEIGTGSGYVTALLHVLAGSVCSVEAKAVLLDSALQRLRAAGHGQGCELVQGDGLGEDATEAHFDRILVNGTFPAGGVPAAVTSHLVAGGRLVAGIDGGKGEARLLVVERGEDGELATREGGKIRLSRLFMNAT